MPSLRQIYAGFDLLSVLRQGFACLPGLRRQDISQRPILSRMRSTYLQGTKRRSSCRAHFPGLVAVAPIIGILWLRLGRGDHRLVTSTIQRPEQGHRSALVWHHIDYNRDRCCSCSKCYAAAPIERFKLLQINPDGIEKAEVAEPADATDLKSVGLRPLRVQIPPSALRITRYKLVTKQQKKKQQRGITTEQTPDI